MGWLFMAFVIVIEAFIMSKYFTGEAFSKRVYLSSLISNAISGIIGIIASLSLTGGWWLVVWFPWVSSHEVDIRDSQELLALVIYYFVAMILSVLIELLSNHLYLRKEYPFSKILSATLRANTFSYILGAILIILLCV